MNRALSENHPLRRLFSSLAERAFIDELKWPDRKVSGYLADLLVDFTHVDRLHKIRDGKGQPVREIAMLLLEADLLLHAGTINREREVHRHIGDFTLFMVGLFPEFLKRIRIRNLVHHPDYLIDYVRVGKKSYRNVSEFDFGEHRGSGPLFRKLSENFEICVVGLGCIRESLKRLAKPELNRAREILLN